MRAHVLILIMVTTVMGYKVRSLSKKWALNIAPNSVDDAYTSCTNEMSKRISKCLASDMKTNDDFKTAWNTAKKQVDKKENPRNGLTVNHAIAIRVYTNEKPNIYNQFNKAVHDCKDTYKTKFNYHALHFLLTDALKHLKENQKDQEQCVNTYRRTNEDFDKNVVNMEIRFGRFTSASLSDPPTRFGQKSCFKIYTCHGAALGNYSHLQHEKEVLIPPYEKFKVVSVEVSDKEDRWCDVVYTLTSTGTLSNLDCALMQNAV
ncbi:hypothetical protein AALO_G00007760 [Alosa alosa]|uniref:NAD(P)(+)--arginine ADP-ribosyltransferase n=1 Tax=Alosa alosa TaxID=278164 RepID=A0AAV6HIC0_9TELE|nr:ecto-ADP-ribosyltransferase 5-like [Alosa alosa]KAG5285815.1 hypothetical protein AALO_G00007760 [Alosa alosa]